MELTKEQKVLQSVINKAWEDNAFKQALITNPIPVIEDLTNVRIKIPEDKTIVVCDQTDSSIVFINIPAQQNMDDVELTEEQLEIVAGGGDPGAVFQETATPLDHMIED